ncbi:MAG: stage III sporulation protein AD [Clostridia bacterium]|nr:stage III sporulation protein AD [Clostridia bacterium]
MAYGLIGLVIIIIVKQYRPEFAIYISIICGILILVFVMDKLTNVINLIKSVIDKTNINSSFLSILLKITGIAFLAEFAVSVCKDAGESAIASKIEIGSKVIIIFLSIPIISNLLEIIIKILP